MGEAEAKVSKEEVITKLKDDGDFDKLRLKIIRKLKENEELRNRIIAVVKQSAALNRPDAESMKPRQLSDAIFDEVGSNVMSQISDGLWDIIRSESGMKTEITETVESVYYKLVPEAQRKEGESSKHELMAVKIEEVENGFMKDEDDDMVLSDNDEPPGFSLSNNHHQEQQLPVSNQNGHLEDQIVDIDGFSADEEDKDPDVPPGFG